jgi:hypothetical protein
MYNISEQVGVVAMLLTPMPLALGLNLRKTPVLLIQVSSDFPQFLQAKAEKVPGSIHYSLITLPFDPM